MDNDNATPQARERAAYQIGAVCDMTGLSHHVLRVWEKRYGAVRPVRQSNQRRLYSQADVEKLALLKRLVDRGHSIGSIARLSIDELKARAAKSGQAAAGETVDAPTVLLIGRGLAFECANAPPGDHYDVVGCYPDTDHALAAVDRPGARIVVLEWPSLFERSAVRINQAMRDLNAERLVLVYDYASAPALEALNRHRVTAIRGPASQEALSAVIRTLAGTAPADADDGPAPAKRYDDATLARVAALSGTIKCECPRHLARLIMALGRFEDYSADCESLGKEDAALHDFLCRTTGRARSEMELALAKVIETESLEAVTQGAQDADGA